MNFFRNSKNEVTAFIASTKVNSNKLSDQETSVCSQSSSKLSNDLIIDRQNNLNNKQNNSINLIDDVEEFNEFVIFFKQFFNSLKK